MNTIQINHLHREQGNVLVSYAKPVGKDTDVACEHAIHKLDDGSLLYAKKLHNHRIGASGVENVARSFSMDHIISTVEDKGFSALLRILQQ